MTGASIFHARPSIKQGRSTMTTRREFIFAAAAGAAMLTRISSALAATYDLVIKGGRVIDPAARINAMRDVAIVGRRIAALHSNVAADERHRDTIIGVKARLSFNVVGPTDLDALKRAQEVAGDLPVMIHIGQTVSSMPKILALLKRGDIVTHMYAPEPNSILDGNGR